MDGSGSPEDFVGEPGRSEDRRLSHNESQNEINTDPSMGSPISPIPAGLDDSSLAVNDLNQQNGNYTVQEIHNKTNFNIIQFNPNGIVNKFEEIKLLIHKYEPSLLCIQETHLKPNRDFKMKSFSEYRKDGTLVEGDRAKGGVLTLVKSEIPHKQLNIQTSLQAVAIQVQFPFKFTVCNIYIPPSQSIDINDINTLFRQLPRPFIFMGDLNAHSPLWDNNCSRSDNRGKLFEDILTENQLYLYNTGEPTHMSFAYGSMSSIDICLTNMSLSNRFTWSVHNDLCGSDHYPIVLSLNEKIEVRNIMKKWKIRKANWEKYQDLAILNRTFEDVQEQTQYINSVIISAAEQAIPKTSGRYKRPPVPWWNEEIRDSIRERKRIKNLLKRTFTQQLHLEYKKICAKTKFLIKQSKRKTWESYVSTISPKTDSFKVWQKINKIKGNTSYNPIRLLEYENHSITNEIEIAKCLAETFQMVSSNESYSQEFLEIKSHSEELQIFPHQNTNDEYNCEITVEEIQRALLTCKGSSPGPDNIHYDMLKKLPIDGLLYICEFYNTIWRKGEFPSEWQNAIVVPIYKRGKPKTSPNSYRPISLTSCLCKLMEKVVSKRMDWYFVTNNIITNSQFGFRTSLSTLDGLISLESNIREAFAKQMHGVAVFLDLEKAYDRTWRYHILRKLESVNVKGQLFNFVKNFLMNRTFQVCIGDKLTNKYNLENGVPQGSVLSVKLFLLAINDVVNQIDPSINVYLYADDIVLFYKHKSMEAIETQLQTALNSINNWMKTHGFKISPEKSTIVHFCRKYKSHRDPSLTVENNPIPVVAHQRYLGVEFDRKLTWHIHIDKTKKSAMKSINVLKALSGTQWGANRDSLLMIHNALIVSKLNYGAPVFSTASKTALQKLNPVHNLGIRLATGAFRTSRTSSIIVDAGVLPLGLMREKLSLNFYVKLRTQRFHPLYLISSSISSLSIQRIGKNSYFHYIKVLLDKYELDNVTPSLQPPLPTPWLILSNIEDDQDLYSYRKIKEVVQKRVWEHWQSEWDQHEDKLKLVKPKVTKWGTYKKLTRKESVALTRLRIGHTKYTHSYLIERTTNICETCGIENTVEHLLHCNQFIAIRVSCGVKDRIQDATINKKTEIDNLMKFLKQTGLIEFL